MTEATENMIRTVTVDDKLFLRAIDVLGYLKVLPGDRVDDTAFMERCINTYVQEHESDQPQPFARVTVPKGEDNPIKEMIYGGYYIAEFSLAHFVKYCVAAAKV